MGGNTGGGSVLDHHHAVVLGWVIYLEIAMSELG